MIVFWLALFPALAGASAQNSDPGQALKRLRPPVEVARAKIFSDGGTICLTFSDRLGSSLEACLDGRLGSPSAGKVFLSVSHPSRGGRPLARGLEEENTISGWVERWLEGHPRDPNSRLARDFLAGLRRRGMEEAAASARGPFTRDQAVEEAAKAVPLKMNGLRVEENPEEYIVKFVTDPFDDGGKKKQSDFVVRLSKATRKVLFAGAVKVREVP